MQDYRAIPGLARRVLGATAGGGGSGGGGGVLRGYSPPSAGKQIDPIKCPRCDSTNTKFCYYNNYNLAQPRHFCKSCRRYWTKGGVLRNVPVGGGCRKSKPSSSKPSGGGAGKDSHRYPSTANRSDSDSGRDNSNLAEPEASTSAPFPDFTLMATYPDRNPETAPCFGPSMSIEDPLAQAAEILPDSLTASGGSFTNLLPRTVTHPIVKFRIFSDTPAIQFPFPAQSIAGEDQIGVQSDSTNPTVAIDPHASTAARAAGFGIAGMDWPTSVDPALFDLPAAYWNQGHWGDADPALYLL